jgi:hypothetical protein
MTRYDINREKSGGIVLCCIWIFITLKLNLFYESRSSWPVFSYITSPKLGTNLNFKMMGCDIICEGGMANYIGR